MAKLHKVIFIRKGTNHEVGYSTTELNYSTRELIEMQMRSSWPNWYRKVYSIADDWGWYDGKVYTREVNID